MQTDNWQEFSQAQWLAHLETDLGAQIQLGLERVRAVGVRLDLLKPAACVIAVAGTNGKGSTVALLESIYLEAGLQVGSYTSPHLLQFNERICINKQPISEADLCAAFAAVEAVRQDTHLTYFEMATLAALVHFKNMAAQVIILEVGLGGRLDATNIIDADLAIITTIDWDHMDYLGNSLEAIGREKAGIMRPGKICIYGDDNMPESIGMEAKSLGVRLFCHGQDYQVTTDEDSWNLSLSATNISLNFSKPLINLKSASAASLAAVLLEEQLPVPLAAKTAAMQSVYIPGRSEFFNGEIACLLDVAHNPQAARLLAINLQNLQWSGKIHAVFACLNDKDIDGIINPLKDMVHYWYPANLDTSRALDEEALLDALRRSGVNIRDCYGSPIDAYMGAKSLAQAGDLIVVYGSFFTVGQVMEYRKQETFMHQ